MLRVRFSRFPNDVGETRLLYRPINRSSEKSASLPVGMSLIQVIAQRFRAVFIGQRVRVDDIA